MALAASAAAVFAAGMTISGGFAIAAGACFCCRMVFDDSKKCTITRSIVVLIILILYVMLVLAMTGVAGFGWQSDTPCDARVPYGYAEYDKAREANITGRVK